jgi:hypothetical protein
MMKDINEFGDPPTPGETDGSIESALGDPPTPGEGEEEEEGDPPTPGGTELPGGTGD